MPYLSAGQFGDWLGFDMIEPIGSPGDDVRNAILPLLIAEIFKGKAATSPKIGNFIIQWERRFVKEELDPLELAEKLKAALPKPTRFRKREKRKSPKRFRK